MCKKAKWLLVLLTFFFLSCDNLTDLLNKGNTENTENTEEKKETEELEVYTISYDLLKGNWNEGFEPTSNYTKNDEIILPQSDKLTKIGYDFIGWTENEDSSNIICEKIEKGSTGNKIFKAVWKESTDTPYIVTHFLPRLDWENAPSFWVIADEQNLKGTTGAETNAVAKDYKGFTPQPFKQRTISADGSTIIAIYYKRNTITYTFNSNGINLAIMQGLYEEKVEITEIKEPTREGYVFSGWDKTVPLEFGDTDLTFNAEWIESTETVYTVNYKDSYGLSFKTKKLKGTTNGTTNAEAEEFEGLTAKPFTQKTISADGSTVVNIYYEKNTITYTFNPNGGNWDGSTENMIVSGLYSDYVTYLKKPVRAGYTFVEWNETVPLRFTADDKTFTAVWSVNSNTIYTVKHWKQNTEGNDYELVERDTRRLRGTTDTATEASAETYTGFTVKPFEQENIAGDESTVVNIYYDRNMINFTFDADGGNWNGNTENKIVSGRYGAAVIRPENPVRENYYFVGWDESIPEVYDVEALTFKAVWSSANSTEGSVIAPDLNLTIHETGHSITFTAEECDSYSWALNDAIYLDSSRIHIINKLELPEGVYTVSLKAEKNGLIYSYSKQFIVEFINATAETIENTIKGMTKNGTIRVTGPLTTNDIRTINSALKALKELRPQILVTLDLHRATDLTELESAQYQNPNYSFYGCENLSGILLPDSLLRIQDKAFYGCKELVIVTMPFEVNYIGEGAFCDCSELTEITMPFSLSSLKNDTFRNCKKLTSITLPSDLSSIGQAFYGCSGLKEITIPSSVVFLDGSFSGCSSLESITLPPNISHIGNYTFTSCKGLTEITIPSKVIWIGNSAFAGCTGLTEITLPSSVTTIREWAFSGCTGLTSITIPSSVTTIGDCAFSGCTRLTSITIPSGVTTIEEYTFQDCAGLTEITIPSNITTIGVYAFMNCTELTSITIQSNSIHISPKFLSHCKKLTHISLSYPSGWYYKTKSNEEAVQINFSADDTIQNAIDFKGLFDAEIYRSAD